jgi:hypothetical protein
MTAQCRAIAARVSDAEADEVCRMVLRLARGLADDVKAGRLGPPAPAPDPHVPTIVRHFGAGLVTHRSPP